MWVHSLSASGQVQDIINEREAEVQVGFFRLKVLLDGLELRQRPQPQQETTISPGGMMPANIPGMELDLRGMRVEETLAMLDDYIDSAYLAELPWVRIIHGKGTGALRQVVGDFLRNHPVVSRFRSGEAGRRWRWGDGGLFRGEVVFGFHSFGAVDCCLEKLGVDEITFSCYNTVVM